MYGRVGVSVMTKTKSKYTNDHFVPVKSIVNGMIILDNNNKSVHSYSSSSKGDYLVRLIGDDLDTILVTDNNGLQSKPYNLLETSYRESDSVYWGDANNVFFYMFDQCFESEIKTYLASVINTAFKNSNSMEDKSNYFYKVFFNV